MITQATVLVQLLWLVDCIPAPLLPQQQGRGRPVLYSDRLFLKALVIMIVRRLHTVQALLTVGAEPTPEMQAVRSLLLKQTHFPSWRTFERRLKRLP